MDNFTINGIQQVGVGTENFNKSWNWLIEMFGAENSAMLRQDIKRRKAIDFLYENAEITDVEAKPPVAEAKSEEAAEEKPAEEKTE